MTAGRRRAEPARGGLAPGRRWAGLRLALATAVGVLAATSTLAASAQAGVAQQFRDLKSTRLTASSSTMRPGWVTDAQLANTAALRRALDRATPGATAATETPTPADVSAARYDTALRDQVAAFQMTAGLKPDGMARAMAAAAVAQLAAVGVALAMGGFGVRELVFTALFAFFRGN